MAERPPLSEFFKSPLQKKDLEPVQEEIITIVRGKRGERGVKGEPGKDADSVEIAEIVAIPVSEILKDDKEFIEKTQGKKGERGERGFVGEKGDDGKNGKDGSDGKDGISETAKEIVEKINRGRTKISKDKIDGLDELEGRFRGLGNQMQNIASLGGTRQTAIKSNGKLIGTGIQTVNFLNAIITPVGDGSEVTVSTTASTGGGITGTVNGSNLTFVASTPPSIVFTEGGHFINGFGVTITGLTIVFDSNLAPQQWIKYI